MIHKVGTGGAAGSIKQAINYVLGEKDHDQITRAGVTLLEGDPAMLADIEQTMTTKNTYVHTSLSFTKKETEMINANSEILEEILSSYKEQLAAGLPGADASRLASMSVRHDEADGKMHVHMLTLRQDLETGKSYQPFVSQRGDIARFKDWNVVMQNEYGLENPNSKEHQKTAVWSKNLPKKVEAVRDAIDSKISDMVSSNQIQNRQQVIKFINNTEHMKVARMTPNFISVKVDGHKRNIKLLGAIYAKSFTSTQSVRQSMEQRAEVNVEQSKQRLSESMSNLAKASHHKYEASSVDMGRDTISNINNTVSVTNSVELGQSSGNRTELRNSDGTAHEDGRWKDVAEGQSMPASQQRAKLGATRKKITTPTHRIFNGVTYNEKDASWTWQGSYGYAQVTETENGYSIGHGNRMEWQMAAELLKNNGASHVSLTCSNEQSMMRAIQAHAEAGLKISNVKLNGIDMPIEKIKDMVNHYDETTKITRTQLISGRAEQERQTDKIISSISNGSADINKFIEQQSDYIEQASSGVKQLIDTIESELEQQRQDEYESSNEISLS